MSHPTIRPETRYLWNNLLLMSRPVELAALLLLTTLTSSSCGDRRPVWSLSTVAVEELGLDARTAIEDGSFGDPTTGNCRAVLRLQLSTEQLSESLSPEELKATLLLATDIQLECIGGCGSTESCKTHHRVRSPDSHWATTGCVCDPELLEPCRLDLRWAVGDTSRRKIDQLVCGEPAAGNTCKILLFRDGTDLQITCESEEVPALVDSPFSR